MESDEVQMRRKRRWMEPGCDVVYLQLFYDVFITVTMAAIDHKEVLVSPE